MKTKIEDIIGKEIKDLGVIFKLTDKLHKLFSEEVEEIIGGSNFEHYGKFNHGRLINKFRKQLREKNDKWLQQQHKLNKEIL